jgi:hypothetical protein
MPSISGKMALLFCPLIYGISFLLQLMPPNAKSNKYYFRLKDKSNFLMVHDHLWERFGVGDGYLCLSCFGKRLGRPLTLEDFRDVICNTRDNPFYKTLINKLTSNGSGK